MSVYLCATGEDFNCSWRLLHNCIHGPKWNSLAAPPGLIRALPWLKTTHGIYSTNKLKETWLMFKTFFKSFFKTCSKVNLNAHYRNCLVTRPPPLKLISKGSDGFGRLGLSGSFSGQNMMSGFTVPRTAADISSRSLSLSRIRSRRTAAAGISWKMSFSKFVKKKNHKVKEKLEKNKQNIFKLESKKMGSFQIHEKSWKHRLPFYFSNTFQ